MNPYVRDIMKLLRCPESDAQMIEYIMREEIFHSTLDWQTEAQFNHAARQAARILAADRDIYEEHFRAVRAVFQRMKEEREEREKAVAYEI